MPMYEDFKRYGSFPSGVSQGQVIACAPPTPGNFQVATSGGYPIGIAMQDVATGSSGMWKAFGWSQETQVDANATTFGDTLYFKPGGQVGTNPTLGVLLTAGINMGPNVAAGNGTQWIELLWLY